MITFLASQFEPVDIKVGFSGLIGKVGCSFQTAFYLLPSHELNWWKSLCWLIM